MRRARLAGTLLTRVVWCGQTVLCVGERFALLVGQHQHRAVSLEFVVRLMPANTEDLPYRHFMYRRPLVYSYFSDADSRGLWGRLRVAEAGRDVFVFRWDREALIVADAVVCFSMRQIKLNGCVIVTLKSVGPKMFWQSCCSMCYCVMLCYVVLCRVSLSGVCWRQTSIVVSMTVDVVLVGLNALAVRRVALEDVCLSACHSKVSCLLSLPPLSFSLCLSVSMACLFMSWFSLLRYCYSTSKTRKQKGPVCYRAAYGPKLNEFCCLQTGTLRN